MLTIFIIITKLLYITSFQKYFFDKRALKIDPKSIKSYDLLLDIEFVTFISTRKSEFIDSRKYSKICFWSPLQKSIEKLLELDLFNIKANIFIRAMNIEKTPNSGLIQRQKHMNL